MQAISALSLKRYEVTALGFLAPVVFGRADVDAFLQPSASFVSWTAFAGFGALLITLSAETYGLFVFGPSGTVNADPQIFVGHGQWVFS
jgi:hypothetical protein